MLARTNLLELFICHHGNFSLGRAKIPEKLTLLAIVFRLVLGIMVRVQILWSEIFHHTVLSNIQIPGSGTYLPGGWISLPVLWEARAGYSHPS